MNNLKDLFRKTAGFKGTASFADSQTDPSTNFLNDATPVTEDKKGQLLGLFNVLRTLTDETTTAPPEVNESESTLTSIQTEFGAKDDNPLILLHFILQQADSTEHAIIAVKQFLEKSVAGKKMVLELLDLLLLIDAELEHRLMIEYLYAAYSIDVETENTTLKPLLIEWQQMLTSIAREEMGHLISVQNVRKSLGLNIYFNVKYLSELTRIFPYISQLEPFSKTSLAKYIFAESPPKWIESDDPNAIRVRQLLDAEIGSEDNKLTNDVDSLREYVSQYGYPISALFKVMLFILEHLTTEDDFKIASVTQQAKPEQWNRGYTSDERSVNINGTVHKMTASNVLVETAMTRWECVQAIQAVAEQGENANEDTVYTDETTHFNRFLKIFKYWDSHEGSDFNPSKNMATNPYVGEDTDLTKGTEHTKIEDPLTQKWARLFNLRYNLLLTFIEHSFHIETNCPNPSSSFKGLVINNSFGEMYNLKALSHVISGLKMSTTHDLLAGPPFQIHPIQEKRYLNVVKEKATYTDYPALYRTFIEDSKDLIQTIPDHETIAFLNTMQNADQELLALLPNQQSTAVL